MTGMLLSEIRADGPVEIFISGFLSLVLGAVLGLTSRFLLGMVGRRSNLSASAAVLAGIGGSAIGGLVAFLIDGASSNPPVLLMLLFSVIGTILVLLIAERFLPDREASTADLLLAGESAGVEFKSTARHNVRSGKRDERMELVIAKTVAGYLNANGGVLLIGVDDDGRPLGLDDDLQHMKQPDLDRYELWLHDFLTRTMGTPAAAIISVRFPTVQGLAICRIDVQPSPQPVFLRPPKTDKVQFMVRIGNSTRELSVAEAIDYAAQHFGGPRWRRRPQEGRSLEFGRRRLLAAGGRR